MVGEAPQASPQLDEPPRVEMAVLEERAPHRRPFCRRDRVSVQEQARQLEACRLPAGDGQLVVARLGHQRGQHALEREAAAEVRVLDVIADERIVNMHPPPAPPAPRGAPSPLT